MFQGWREGLQNHLAEFDSLASCHIGVLAQLVRALPCHGRGCGFEPRRLRLI